MLVPAPLIMMRRILLILLSCLGALLALAAPAAAHNTLVSSDPPSGATLGAAPAQLSLIFDKSVPLDTISIEIIDATGVRSDLTGSAYGPNGDTQILTPLPALPAGEVNLRWRLVGPDGHPITGRIAFNISAPVATTAIAAVVDPATTTTIAGGATVASDTPNSGFSEPWSTTGATRWILRMISYLAIMTVGGVVATMFFVWEWAWLQRVIRQAVAISLGAAAFAGLAQLLVVASDISGDAPWSSTGSVKAAFETDAGVALLLRLVLLAVLSWVLFTTNRAVEDVRWRASGLIVVALLGTWAYAGHAQSMRWALLGMPLDIAHHAAAAAWIGGLAIVGFVVTKTADRDELVEVVQKFGKLAAVSVSVIVGTGVLQSIRLVGSPGRLFAADHGLYLVAKLMFLGVMLKVADINRKRVSRRFREPTTATVRVTGILRRAMGTELAVGLAVIGVTAAMVVSPPAVASESGDSVTSTSVTTSESPDLTATTFAAVPVIDPASTSASSTTTPAAPAVDVACVMEQTALAIGSSGPNVICLQQKLVALGLYSGEPSGTFDPATDVAVRSLQEQRDLYVDGIVGEETASALGIWP